eukprot:SAG11_NODE_320_length_10806_cov_17.415896_4_plen_171_part_00
MDNVKNKWIPELQAQPMVDLRATKIILVGQKIDLRGVAEFAGEVISTEEGRAIASAIGAAAYVECSAKTREGVKPAFDETCASRLAAFSTTVPPRIHTHRFTDKRVHGDRSCGLHVDRRARVHLQNSHHSRAERRRRCGGAASRLAWWADPRTDPQGTRDHNAGDGERAG